MNEDRILEMFFEKARWQYAIEKGLFKDMNKAVMYQLTTPEARLAMYQRIKSGNYKIMPPHTAKIPKENGDFRTVYVNEAVDRILLSIANDLLFELMPEMVHPRCTSYQKGIGCGCVVQEVSRIIYSADGKIIGWKGDFSKYFDSVPIRFIDWAFDKVEEKYGKSALIDVIRDYYHTDIYFDEDSEKVEKPVNHLDELKAVAEARREKQIDAPGEVIMAAAEEIDENYDAPNFGVDKSKKNDESAEKAEEPVKEESAEDVTEEVEVPDDGNEPAIVEPEEEPEVKEEPKKEEYVNISNPEDNEIYDAPKKPSTPQEQMQMAIDSIEKRSKYLDEPNVISDEAVDNIVNSISFFDDEDDKN